MKCIKKYVGPPGTVDERYTGVARKRKMYDIKCLECPFLASQLHKHLTTKHHYVSEAKFKESEKRVFYSWSQKDKHSTPKPLPCKTCKIWHTRLGIHLKNIHKISNDEITRRKNEACSKHWNSSGARINSKIGITESDTSSAPR